MAKAVFGGGCFWCLDAVFRRIDGIKNVICGYAGGKRENPTYEQVCTGVTGHAEVVMVEFDENKISFKDLLDIFFEIHDPTQLNRQGNDTGTQYRSIILYLDEKQKEIAQKKIEELKSKGVDVVTELKPLDKFYPAEEYHQIILLKILKSLIVNMLFYRRLKNFCIIIKKGVENEIGRFSKNWCWKYFFSKGKNAGIN